MSKIEVKKGNKKTHLFHFRSTITGNLIYVQQSVNNGNQLKERIIFIRFYSSCLSTYNRIDHDE